jgi:hypothetical protein
MGLARDGVHEIVGGRAHFPGDVEMLQRMQRFGVGGRPEQLGGIRFSSFSAFLRKRCIFLFACDSPAKASIKFSSVLFSLIL